jgi:hypothetical protein
MASRVMTSDKLKLDDKAILQAMEKHKNSRNILLDVKNEINYSYHPRRFKPYIKSKPELWEAYKGYCDRVDITDEQISDALERNLGLLSYTAKDLDMSWLVLKKRITLSKDLKKKCEESTEQISDLCVYETVKSIRQGCRQSREFWLNHKGQSHGFGKESENILKIEMDPIENTLARLDEDALNKLKKLKEKEQKIIDVSHKIK